MRLLTLWLLLAAPTLAAPDARKVYRAEMKQLRRAATKFWDAFPNRQTQAYNRFMEPYWDMVRAMNQGRGTTRDLVWNFSEGRSEVDRRMVRVQGGDDEVANRLGVTILRRRASDGAGAG